MTRFTQSLIKAGEALCQNSCQEEITECRVCPEGFIISSPSPLTCRPALTTDADPTCIAGQIIDASLSSCSPAPTYAPTIFPTAIPTHLPTTSSTASPTVTPITMPTGTPTSVSTTSPSATPTASPSATPTKTPTETPTTTPTAIPTNAPTESPTSSPTTSPSHSPTDSPTHEPTYTPSTEPTNSPTAEPTLQPSNSPTQSPNLAPTAACCLPGQLVTENGCSITIINDIEICEDASAPACYDSGLEKCILISQEACKAGEVCTPSCTAKYGDSAISIGGSCMIPMKVFCGDQEIEFDLFSQVNCDTMCPDQECLIHFSLAN